jgi:putative CocE/NonD family hydrolase
MAGRTAAATTPWEVMVARQVMVPMRDGVRLATDVYFPARGCERCPGPLPVVLLRTPYGKSGDAGTGEYYARHGYAFAAQDTRGRNGSEGTFYAFAGEDKDGYDAVEWLAGQAWCDGRVGTLGASYCAAAQSALACLAPPHLSAMVVQFGPSSYFHSSMRQNGVLELRFLMYAFNMAASSREAAADAGLRRVLEEAARHARDYLDAGPIRRGCTPLALVPSYEQWALDIQTHVLYDDFWQQPGFGPRAHYDEHADVPTLYVGGWYDTYTRGTLENVIEMRRRQRQPVHLLMGPWHHGGVGLREAGDCLFAPTAALDFEAVRRRWFEQWLKGLDQGLLDEPPVRYFLMGGTAPRDLPGADGPALWRAGEWRTAPAWPLPECQPSPLYLHGDGTLSPLAPAASAAAASTYTYDPQDPVPTIGGNLSAMPQPGGGFDQCYDERFTPGRSGLRLAARPDVLCFQTPPFAAPREMVGPVRARLFVSSTAPDTDFTVKLIEVLPATAARPAGTALNLTDSIGRLRFHGGYEREERVPPGEIVTLDIELFPTAVRVEVGHCLRLDVSSSNYPRFERNRNSGEALGSERCQQVAQNTLHHSRAHASYIELPWLVATTQALHRA